MYAGSIAISVMTLSTRRIWRTMLRRRPGPYQVQASIAACHATALKANDTDWAEIALLHDQLGQMARSPVVELNRAVAIAMVQGPPLGLAEGRQTSSWTTTTLASIATGNTSA